MFFVDECIFCILKLWIVKDGCVIKSVICVMVFESVVKIIGENYLNLIVVSDDFDEYIIYGKIISMWFWYMFLSFLLVLLNFLINCY